MYRSVVDVQRDVLPGSLCGLDGGVLDHSLLAVMNGDGAGSTGARHQQAICVMVSLSMARL